MQEVSWRHLLALEHNDLHSCPVSLSSCGKEGHFAKDCEEPEKCRRCGEEGHKVADCTQEMKTRVIEDEDGTKREIYVPKEMEDDKLFDQGIGSGINFDKFDNIPVSLSLKCQL